MAPAPSHLASFAWGGNRAGANSLSADERMFQGIKPHQAVAGLGVAGGNPTAGRDRTTCRPPHMGRLDVGSSRPTGARSQVGKRPPGVFEPRRSAGGLRLGQFSPSPLGISIRRPIKTIVNALGCHLAGSLTVRLAPPHPNGGSYQPVCGIQCGPALLGPFPGPARFSQHIGCELLWYGCE